MKKCLNVSLLMALLLLVQCKVSQPIVIDYDIQKTNIGQKAAVVAAHPLASEVGLKILQAGGNAVDAAIAVQFALAVVYPVAGNIGGGGFMVYRQNDGIVDALDFREKGPAAASRDMYLDDNKDMIKGLSLSGHLASGVPGSVDGMVKAFEKYSQLKDWKKLLQPAVDLAERGFTITERQARGLNRSKEAFMKNNTITPIFVRGELWKAGDVLQQADLAETLKRIQEQGRAGFYEGETAQLVVDEMQRGNGIMTLEDLKNYQAAWRTPLTTDYRGHKVISMPPASSGGVALIQLLEMIEPFPMSTYGFHSAEAVHVMIEAERRVYADRSQHLGDSDFYPVPIKQLLSPEYLSQRSKSIKMDMATLSQEILAGEFEEKESEETTHFSIVDEAGNAVSITTTINTGYGCKTVVGGAGFLLNNEMDDFSAKPGLPNVFGLIGAEANAIAPGKRMLSSMTPTIVEKDGQLFMVVGTPGGSTIITSVFQTIVNVVDFGMTMSEAVQAPRFHHQWKPTYVSVEEKALSSATRSQLEALGHELKPRGSIGRVDAILIRNGQLEGAADPRGDDHAAVY